MDRREQRKGKSYIGSLIVVAVALLNIFGIAGLIIIAIAVAVWGMIKAAQKPAVNGDERPLSAERPVESGRVPRQRMNPAAPPHRPSVPRPASVAARAEDYRRIEELKDLLEAGIIDHAEYRDRMAELEAQMR